MFLLLLILMLVGSDLRGIIFDDLKLMMIHAFAICLIARGEEILKKEEVLLVFMKH